MSWYLFALGVVMILSTINVYYVKKQNKKMLDELDEMNQEFNEWNKKFNK